MTKKRLCNCVWKVELTGDFSESLRKVYNEFRKTTFRVYPGQRTRRNLTINDDFSHHGVVGYAAFTVHYGPIKGNWRSDIQRWVDEAIAKAYVQVEANVTLVSREYLDES